MTSTSVSTSAATGTTVKNLGTFGTLGLIGGLIAVGASTWGLFIDPDIGDFRPWMAVTTVALVLMVFTLVGLLRSSVPATTTSKVALRVALAGLAVLIVGHGLSAFDQDWSETPVFPLGDMLRSGGLLVAGTSLARSGHWSGPQRFVPLACGIYPFAVVAPAMAIHGDIWFPSLIGFGVLWSLLGYVVSKQR
jgi:hypothetical protein